MSTQIINNNITQTTTFTSTFINFAANTNTTCLPTVLNHNNNNNNNNTSNSSNVNTSNKTSFNTLCPVPNVSPSPNHTANNNQLNVVQYLSLLKSKCYETSDKKSLSCTFEQCLKQIKILCKILGHEYSSEQALKIRSTAINILSYLLGNVQKETADALKKYFYSAKNNNSGFLVNAVLNIDIDQILNTNSRLQGPICFLLGYLQPIPGIPGLPRFRKSIFKAFTVFVNHNCSEKVLCTLLRLLLVVNPDIQEVQSYRITPVTLTLLETTRVQAGALLTLLFRLLSKCASSFAELLEMVRGVRQRLRWQWQKHQQQLQQHQKQQQKTQQQQKLQQQQQTYISHFFGLALEMPDQGGAAAMASSDLRAVVDLGRDPKQPLRSHSYYKYLLKLLQKSSHSQFLVMLERGLFQILEIRWAEVKESSSESIYFSIIQEIRRLSDMSVMREAVEEKLENLELKEHFFECVKNCRTKEMFFSLKEIYCSYFRQRISNGWRF